MSDFTKGIELEIRTHRLAWYLGYFARRRIILYSDMGNPITDIDVLGIKFDSTLNPSIIIFETKSEKGYASILKVKGLLDYFEAELAYIIRPNITPDIIRFSETLKINAMHTSRLDEIEDSMNIDKNEWNFFYSLDMDYKLDHYIKLLEENKYEALTFNLNDIWIKSNSFSNTKELIELLDILYLESKKVKNQELKDAIIFLILEYISLLIIQLIKIAGILYKYPTHQRYPIFQEKLISGKLTSKEKDELLDRFYDFLTSYTKNLRKKMTLKRNDLTLLPDYTDKLYELINIYISNNIDIIKILKYIDIINSMVINKQKKDKLLIKNLAFSESDEVQLNKIIENTLMFLFKEKPNFYNDYI